MFEGSKGVFENKKPAPETENSDEDKAVMSRRRFLQVGGAAAGIAVATAAGGKGIEWAIKDAERKSEIERKTSELYSAALLEELNPEFYDEMVVEYEAVAAQAHEQLSQFENDELGVHETVDILEHGELPPVSEQIEYVQKFGFPDARSAMNFYTENVNDQSGSENAHVIAELLVMAYFMQTVGAIGNRVKFDNTIGNQLGFGMNMRPQMETKQIKVNKIPEANREAYDAAFKAVGSFSKRMIDSLLAVKQEAKEEVEKEYA